MASLPLLVFRMASSYENPSRATQYQSTKRFDNLQADVNQVVDVMKDNLDKVLERDAKLSTLENRAEILQTGASQFTTNAGKLKRKYWWKNLKMWIILIIVIVNCSNHCDCWATNDSDVPPASTNGSSPKLLAQLQAQVSTIVDIMRKNVDMALDRDRDLLIMTQNAEKLEESTQRLKKTTEKVKRKYEWKNLKMWIILIIIIVNCSHHCNCWTTNGSGVPSAAAGGGGSKRLAQQQAQVDEVVDIMRQNVDKVLERDKNLSLLDDRADKLQHNAAQFEQHAGKLKRKYWWKNMKMMIIMGVVGIIFAIVVIAWIGSKVKSVAPVLPSGGVTTTIPSVNNGLPKVPGGSMNVASGNRPSTKRRFRTGRPKTTPTISVTTTSPVVTSSNDDEQEQSNTEDAAKAAIKRVIRALVNRQ
ncbi:unnamed protein product [Rotaria sp. Silwood1]|nr:unnamed protein product [Rotaria sp. Silwood1]